MSTEFETSTPAVVWLQRGQSLETAGCFEEAVAAYDRALDAAPSHGRLAGLVWMNRGNALQKLAAGSRDESQQRDDVAAAVFAYDEAIVRFAALRLAEPTFRNHLGAAWLNRGHALVLIGHPDAIVSFTHAIAHLEQLPLESDLNFRLNLAGAHVNLAHALFTSDPARARTHAAAALALLDGHDRAHLAFAEMSLRARRALVMALHATGNADTLTTATDAIDAGLALALHWESRDITALRPLALRLFRLGAQLYRVHQPHFLAEFMLENLTPGAFADDADFRAAANEALTLALADLKKPQLLLIGDVPSTRLLETAHSLRAAREQLSALSHPLK
jgi:tetratricopeptide (TPR) repeat protein